MAAVHHVRSSAAAVRMITGMMNSHPSGANRILGMGGCYAKTRQKAEGRRQKAEGRRQKAESRRQKAEGRKQKAESRRQKSLAKLLPSACFLLPLATRQ